jgi:hypothetical protein
MSFRAEQDPYPPCYASLYDVRNFFEENDVRVHFNWEALEREWDAGSVSFSHNQKNPESDYHHVYAPWYTTPLSDTATDYNHWLRTPWSFAELSNTRKRLPDEHAEQIKALQANSPLNEVEILTLKVDKQTLVLDGNHRLAACLRQANPSATISELRITAKAGTKIVPDVWRWSSLDTHTQKKLGLARAGVGLVAGAVAIESMHNISSDGLAAANVALMGVSIATFRLASIKDRVTHRLSQNRAQGSD